ncbi:MAG: response regulator [Chitinispirillales bacterium]|jgi:CheY-like chemotaxis protein|nr:response regulator [Chitinispirillales bacterium]
MKKKILLIDDNHDTLDLLELFLYNDYEIITAVNGFEGLTKAEKELPDLISTDITMPVMDGIRFFNRARKSELIRETPIIAVTSFAKNINIKSLLNLGFCGVIPKPLEREAVITTVAKAMEFTEKKNGKGEAVDGEKTK